MGTGIAYSAIGGGNPTIQNQALVSRKQELAVAVNGVIDGSTVADNGVVLRGTVLVWTNSANKYHSFLHGTDTLVRGQFLIAIDNITVQAGVDKPFSGYREGFFNLADLLDGNAANNMVLADFTTTAGFYQLNALPGGSTTELRLTP